MFLTQCNFIEIIFAAIENKRNYNPNDNDMMFIQWHKIEGHSNPNPRRGFADSQKLMKDKQRLGNDLLQTGDAGGFNADSRRRNANFQKILQAVGLLFLLVSLAVMVLLQAKKYV